MAEKSVKMIFPANSVKRKVLDNVENYLNMQFQPKMMQRSRENGQKPHFGPNLGPILGQDIFFSKIRKRHFSRLTKG